MENWFRSRARDGGYLCKFPRRIRNFIHDHSEVIIIYLYLPIRAEDNVICDRKIKMTQDIISQLDSYIKRFPWNECSFLFRIHSLISTYSSHFQYLHMLVQYYIIQHCLPHKYSHFHFFLLSNTFFYSTWNKIVPNARSVYYTEMSNCFRIKLVRSSETFKHSRLRRQNNSEIIQRVFIKRAQLKFSKFNEWSLTDPFLPRMPTLLLSATIHINTLVSIHKRA